MIKPCLKEIMQQAGYPNLESLLFLYNLVASVRPSLVLELGTGYGCSTAFMAMAIWGGLIISIDDYRDEAKDIKTPLTNLEKCGVSGKVLLIEGNTFEAGQLIRERVGEAAPEIVFMDASHLDALLREEYQAISGLLPDDHLIVVDDLFANDVHVFVAKLFQDNPKYLFCHSIRHHRGMAVLGTNLKYIRSL